MIQRFEVSFTNGELTDLYLCSSADAVSESLICTALLIRGTSGESLSAIDSAHYISKVILCPRHNDVHHISEDVLNSPDAQVKTCPSVHSVDCETEGRYFSVQSESYLTYFCVFPSTIELFIPVHTHTHTKIDCLFYCRIRLELTGGIYE
jgi:hypothetical protein